MASAVHGRSGAAAVGTDAVASITGFSYDEAVDETETTAMQDEAKTFLGGLRDGSGQLDCWWLATDVGHEALLAGFAAGTTVALVLYPEGNTAGKVQYAGDALIKSVGLAQTKDDIITISFQFRGFLTKTTIS